MISTTIDPDNYCHLYIQSDNTETRAKTASSNIKDSCSKRLGQKASILQVKMYMVAKKK